MEASLKTFLDNCSEYEEFRLAVKRKRPKTIDEAVTTAMQEECIRLTENRKPRDPKILKPSVYQTCFNSTNQDATKDIRESRNAVQRRPYYNRNQTTGTSHQNCVIIVIQVNT